MCFFSTPSIPPPPTPASFQPAQTPKDMTQAGKPSSDMFKRRGLASSIFAGMFGGAPLTTATTGGSTGTTGA